MKRIIFILYALSLTSTAISQSFPPFCLNNTPSNYTFKLVVQDLPSGICSMDIDNDGKSDLVYPSLNILKRRLGIGNGQFAGTTTNISSGGMQYDKIETFDFNNDLFKDLLVSTSGGMAYLRNNTNGTFAASYTIGANPSDYTVNDFNNDGYLDIASVSIFNPTTFAIHRNSTTNTFSTSVNSLTFSAQGITSGDFNNDGNKDILISRTFNFNGYIEFFAGNGAFGFAAPVTVFTVNPNTVEKLRSFDFNNDGLADLAAGQASGASSSIYQCSGSATFTKITDLPRGEITTITFADVNNDGSKDILTTNKLANNLNVVWGSASYNYSLATRYALAYNPVALTINDFNNDGINDVITGCTNYATGIADYNVLLGSSSGLNGAVYFQTGPPSYKGNIGFTPGDFNNDGLPDIATNGDTVRVFQNMGSGTFAQVYKQRVGVAAVYAISAADLNKDGNLDLILGTFTGPDNLTILRGNGNFTFQTPQHIVVGSYLKNIMTFDFNNDTYPDILSSQGIFRNNAGVSFTSITGMTALGNDAFDHGDFNNDGFDDICYARGNGTICTELNNAGTGFNPPTDFTVCGTSIDDITATDYNKDGNTDIIVGHMNCSVGFVHISVRRGNGNNTFIAPFTVTTTGEPMDVLAADVNLDSYTDIVSSGVGGNVDLLINNKAGGFNSYPVKTVSTPKRSFFTDMNNDGKPDIVTGNLQINESDISILYNNTVKISPATNQTLCAGATIYLKKFGSYPGFYWSPGSSTADSIPVSTSGFYSANIPGGINQCSCSIGINVTANPAPTLNISSSNTVCLGSTTTLTVTGAGSYTWSTGANTYSVSVSPSVTTTYSVSGTLSGCSGQTATTMSVVICTGSDELYNELSVQLFPNPNSGQFEVKLTTPFSEQGHELHILNSLGQIVAQYKLEHGTTKISTQGLSGGLYHFIIVKERVNLFSGNVIID